MLSSSIKLLVRLCAGVVVVLVLSCGHLVDATVYTHNYTSGDHERISSYPSLPALFGAQFEDGRLYTARLQYLVEDPFLCDEINVNTTSFVGKIIEATPDLGALDQPDSATALRPEQDNPIVLLAARGSCPFHLKAMVAESLGLQVEYLIIYNHNYDGEDVLVPMYSEYGNTRLKLLSVTHRTGTALKRYIADAPTNVRAAGGPPLTMDGIPPEGIMTAKDLQNVLISTLGLFFMLVSCSGCFLMCAAAAQHGRRAYYSHTHNHGGSGGGGGGDNNHDDNNGNRSSPLWMILMGDPDTDPVMVGDPATTAARAFGARTLLTVQEVEQYLVNAPAPNAGSGMTTGSNNVTVIKDSAEDTTQHTSTSTSSHDGSGDNVHGQVEGTDTPQPASVDAANPLHCAICIDDIDESNTSESILKLPCNHKFHTDCIIPWLTERQSKCPLCKYDVFMYVQERAAQNTAAASAGGSLRQRRRFPSLFFGGSTSWLFSQQSLWMAVHGQEEEEGEEDESTTLHHHNTVELELAEAQSGSVPDATTESVVVPTATTSPRSNQTTDS
ncbi:hypothetical protein ACA910_002619 [Epithemia clementina (nom. ined.)]